MHLGMPRETREAANGTPTLMLANGQTLLSPVAPSVRLMKAGVAPGSALP